MDWLFENLGKLAPVVIFLLYMISSLKGRNAEEEAEDPAAQERARKIQEEIRRKILERQRGSRSQDEGYSDDTSYTARDESVREQARRRETVFEDEEVFETGVPDGEWEPFRPIPPKPREVVETPQAAVFQEDHYEAKRREIANELKRAREMKKAALEKARKAKSSHRSMPAARESYPASQLRSELKEGLQGTQSLRKAMVLKEVLDHPVGMR